MKFIYRTITLVLYPFIIFLIYIRMLRNKEDRIRYKEKLFQSCFKVIRNENSKLLWFHAASVGELKSIIPIIKELKKKNKNLDFLVTTVTLSSGNLANEVFKNQKNIQHRFFPIDVNFLIKKFIESWSPNAIFLVDSEIWPNLIFYAKKKQIPLALINGRITFKTFKRWMSISNFAQSIFDCFNLCLVSNKETKSYLSKLKASNVFFTGNIKLCDDQNLILSKNKNQKFLSQNKVWLAASTHEGEELFCLNTHVRLKKKMRKVFTIIAPRHVERSEKIRALCNKLKLSVQIIDNKDAISKNKEIIIINSYGILPKFLKYIKSVYMGKSILPKLKIVGGQNPVEAAKFGCKIYHGPYVYNFEEIYNLFKKLNISKKILNSQQLSENLFLDFNKFKKRNNKIRIINKIGKKIFKDTMKKVYKFLNNEYS